MFKKVICTSKKALLPDAKQRFQVLSTSERVQPISNHKRLHFGLNKIHVWTLIVLDTQTEQKHETMKSLLFVDLHVYDAADGLKK